MIRRGLLALVVAVLVAWMALGGCSLTTRLDDLTGGQVAGARVVHSIGGRVRGLEGASVTLTENASDFVTLTEDGAFAFQNRLPSGTNYIVAVLRTSDGRTCKLQNAEGQVANADITNVVVDCLSPNAKLANLVVSSGPLSPAFSVNIPSYTASPVTRDLFTPDPPLTITATTESPSATVMINAMPATSGQPTAVSGLHAGPNTFAVVVQAANGTTRTTYTVAVSFDAHDVYVKASNTRAGAFFGTAVALSSDGTTLAVGAVHDASSATGINGDQGDASLVRAGAVYVFRRSGEAWTQEAYLKASNTRSNATFGERVALSSDGSTLAVTAIGESSAGTGINGNQDDGGAFGSGAVYVFRRAGASWVQEAYVKASNTRRGCLFGGSVGLSSDGNTLAVGAPTESSAGTGISGNQTDASASGSGAAYVFTRSGATWTQQVFIKASNASGAASPFPDFGISLALSSDGNTLAVGADGEGSAATGVNGTESDRSAPGAGAVYVFLRSGAAWAQDAYVKASNTRAGSGFGHGVSLSSDGKTLAVGAVTESSGATGVDGNQRDTSAEGAGAAYVFTRAAATWTQGAYLKASNTRSDGAFGHGIAISSNGERLAVSSPNETSASSGLNGKQEDNAATRAGAVYAFVATGTTWAQVAYVKASNARRDANFGLSLALASDGLTLAVGAKGEQSAATGINGSQTDGTALSSGAVYLFR